MEVYEFNKKKNDEHYKKFASVVNKYCADFKHFELSPNNLKC